VTLGGSCPWTIQVGSIGPNSVVYSAGVGGDVSFEKELVRRFGCRVILLDPSPTGIATMNKPENQDPNIDFRPVGLADSDGDVCFGSPINPAEGFYRRPTSSSASGSSFRCASLPTLMRDHDHDHIDLLKIDIEGFEYGVLKQICAQKLKVNQICVEFHHSLVPGVSRRQTISAIIQLLRYGYRLIRRKDWDHTFVLSRERRRQSV
jgi:FkbM family methyltransferase